MSQHISQLARIVAEKTGQPVRVIENIQWETFDAIASMIAGGEILSVTNFGTFGQRTRPAGMGRDVSSGTLTPIPSMQVATFKATGRLKVMVRDGDPKLSIRKPQQKRKQES